VCELLVSAKCWLALAFAILRQLRRFRAASTGQSLVSVDDQGDATEVCALQLTNVKPVQPAVADRMHCLQLTTPTDKICIQAQGARDAEEWRQSIEVGGVVWCGVVWCVVVCCGVVVVVLWWDVAAVHRGGRGAHML